MEIPGTVDLHGKAHAIAVFLKSHEDTLSCKDVLAALATGCDVTTRSKLPMTRFISDRAWAFYHCNKQALAAAYDGVGDAPGDESHLSCYAHFTRSVEKAAHLMADGGNFRELQDDIRTVHDVTDSVVGEVILPARAFLQQRTPVLLFKIYNTPTTHCCCSM